nr:hypothetical protein [Streptococcus mitis]
MISDLISGTSVLGCSAGALPAGFSSATGASESFTPPLNSGFSVAVGASSLTPPVNSLVLGVEDGVSSSFTPPAKSFGSSPLGTSFKFSI